MTHGPWVCGPGCPGWELSRERELEYEEDRRTRLKAWLLSIADKVKVRYGVVPTPNRGEK